MNNLSLTEAELERMLRVFAAVVVATFVIAFVVQVGCFDVAVGTAVIRGFAPAAGVPIFLFGYFCKRGWKNERLAALMARPLVVGVWRGELRSDYGRPKDNLLVVPIVFVVRQTYLSLSVESYTPSQEGFSKIEALLRNSKNKSTLLCYVFELRHLFAGANQLVQGAGELKLSGDQKTLSGNYWTSTPTHGNLKLELLSRDCEGVTSYEDARLKHFPTSP